jgi:hypothetical protein
MCLHYVRASITPKRLCTRPGRETLWDFWQTCRVKPVCALAYKLGEDRAIRLFMDYLASFLLMGAEDGMVEALDSQLVDNAKLIINEGASQRKTDPGGMCIGFGDCRTAAGYASIVARR